MWSTRTRGRKRLEEARFPTFLGTLHWFTFLDERKERKRNILYAEVQGNMAADRVYLEHSSCTHGPSRLEVPPSGSTALSFTLLSLLSLLVHTPSLSLSSSLFRKSEQHGRANRIYQWQMVSRDRVSLPVCSFNECSKLFLRSEDNYLLATGQRINTFMVNVWGEMESVGKIWSDFSRISCLV